MLCEGRTTNNKSNSVDNNNSNNTLESLSNDELPYILPEH